MNASDEIGNFIMENCVSYTLDLMVLHCETDTSFPDGMTTLGQRWLMVVQLLECPSFSLRQFSTVKQSLMLSDCHGTYM